MSEFFTHLAARTLGLAGVLQPRVASIFEPVGPELSPDPRFDGRSLEQEAIPSDGPGHQSAFENETNPLATARPHATLHRVLRGQSIGKFPRGISTPTEPQQEAGAESPVRLSLKANLQDGSTRTAAEGPGSAEKPEPSLNPLVLRAEGLLLPDRLIYEADDHLSVSAHLAQKDRLATSPLRDTRTRGEVSNALPHMLPAGSAESQSVEQPTSSYPGNFNMERLALQPSMSLRASQILRPLDARRFESARSAPTERPPETKSSIQVTIGRVEVRAALTGETSRKERAAPPVMSLEEYLSRRARGAGK
jgi:hypothetical protein